MSKIISSRNYTLVNHKIGAKAKGLSFLKDNGFLCPDFYVLDYDVLTEINNGTCSLKNELEIWASENEIAPNELWAVRSSTLEEDGEERSFAGLFRTEINISTNDLEKAILSVLASYSEIGNTKYFSNTNAGFGVIIQEMIMPDYSGVIFSHNPNDQRDETVFINLIPGLGENLVSGKEEAFTVKFRLGKLSYDEKQQTYNGEIFSQKLIKVSKSSDEIKSDLQKYWTDLVKGAMKLSKVKDCAVDIEFCIANDKIYWLQVRPITTGKDESFIWDNTATEGNYPGVIMPLSISLIGDSFSKAYKGLASYLGMSKRLLDKNNNLLFQMTDEIYGGLYYNVTAWQKLVSQLPFGKRISKSLPSIWGMDKAEFYTDRVRFLWVTKTKMLFRLIFSIIFLPSIKNKFVKRYNQIQNKIDGSDLKSKSYSDLIGIYKELEYKMIDSWDAPLLNNLFTVIVMIISRKLIGKSKLNDLYPNFINDSLFAQSDVISVRIVNDFKAILVEIKNDQNLVKLFNKSDPEDILEKLQVSNACVADRISKYIENYGDRSDQPELKMETITYKENPVRFIVYLKENIRYDFDLNANQVVFDYKSVVKQHYKFNFLYRFLILFVVRQSINRVADRENFRFMRTRTYGLVRRIFREMDSRLLLEKVILEKNDSLYLNVDELLNPKLRDTFSELIRDRKQQYSNYYDIDRSSRYVQTGTRYVPVEPVSDGNISNSVIKGIGCCSGIVRAEVSIFDNDSAFENASGKIFVANYFEPGKLGLFSQAAGLISARGNLLGHTAILCREMGIPSIVGAKAILARVKEGGIIEMNGSTGQIEILKNDE